MARRTPASPDPTGGQAGVGPDDGQSAGRHLLRARGRCAWSPGPNPLRPFGNGRPRRPPSSRAGPRPDHPITGPPGPQVGPARPSRRAQGQERPTRATRGHPDRYHHRMSEEAVSTPPFGPGKPRTTSSSRRADPVGPGQTGHDRRCAPAIAGRTSRSDDRAHLRGTGATLPGQARRRRRGRPGRHHLGRRPVECPLDGQAGPPGLGSVPPTVGRLPVHRPPPCRAAGHLDGHHRTADHHGVDPAGPVGRVRVRSPQLVAHGLPPGE